MKIYPKIAKNVASKLILTSLKPDFLKRSITDIKHGEKWTDNKTDADQVKSARAKISFKNLINRNNISTRPRSAPDKTIDYSFQISGNK